VNQDPVKPAGAGHVDINHVDINNVRPKIRQVVRDGFKFPEAVAALHCFGKVMAGLAAHEWFLAGHGFNRAIIGPIEMRLSAPEGRFCFYPAAEME
jgi:hypothetical protein